MATQGFLVRVIQEWIARRRVRGLVTIREPGRYGFVLPGSDLPNALIDLGEMPLGWAYSIPPQRYFKTDPTQGAPRGKVVPFRGTAMETAATYFERGVGGPYTRVEFLRYAPGQAKALLDAQARLLAQYPRWTVKAAGYTIALQATPLAFPSFGDETLAWRQSAADQKWIAAEELNNDRILIRRGCVLIEVSNTSARSNPQVETEFTLWLARLAEQRLGRIAHSQDMPAPEYVPTPEPIDGERDARTFTRPDPGQPPAAGPPARPQGRGPLG